MPADPLRSAAIALTVAVTSCLTAVAFDEPTKPTPTATAQDPATPAPGHSIHGEAFDDGPRRAARLVEGMGKIDFPVTTTRPEAQAFVNQGVGQLHSFYYFEAERSFRQAAKLDAACPMAYWGMAMANMNNGKRAEGFLKEAIKRAEATKITPRERKYLDALAASYKEGANPKDKRQGYLKGLEAIVEEHPEDLDARAWLAMVTWQGEGSDGIGSRRAVDELIESVLRVEPMHPGAHHYRIHLWDGSKPIRAERSAGLYADTALGIAHAWHMPGHTYTGLKRYADAAYQQEGSARVDHAAMLRDRVMPFEIHNYAHNNQWLATSLSHVGRARDAIVVARNLVEQPRDPQKNGKNDGGSAQRSGRMRWAETLVRYELWDDLIAATESNALDWSDLPLERKERAYALGLAYAAQSDKSKLAEQVAVLKEMADREKAADAKKDEEKKPADGAKEAKKEETPPPAEVKPAEKPAEAPQEKAVAKGGGRRGNRNSRVQGLAGALAELEGHQKRLDGDNDGAFAHFEKASAMRPEALARLQLAAGKKEEAEKTARSNVDRNPGQAPPMAALVEILHGLGKEAEARDAYAKLLGVVDAPDADLPVFTRLAAIASAWESAGTRVVAIAFDAGARTGPRRIGLEPLGPLDWQPSLAPDFARPDTQGQSWSLADHRGRPVLLLLYLGGQCAHCMQQLESFGKEIEAFRSLGADVVAVGTDDFEATCALKANADGIKFPMPLLADPTLEVFQDFGAFDDFESAPMHGTFLIGPDGAIRFQRIAAEPFLDVDFLKGEVERVGRLAPTL